MVDVLCFGEPLVGLYPPHDMSLADAPSITKTWGGDTSNVVLGVARLGHSSRYLTRVGNDPFGKGFIDLWKANGVDVSAVIIDSEHPTGLYFVSFEGKRHSLTYYRKGSAASCLSELDIKKSLVEECSIIHLSGISVGMNEKTMAAGKKLISLARLSERKISFDVNYRPALWKSADAAAAGISSAIGSGVDILEITDDEMLALGWGTEPQGLWQRFPSCGIIIFKQGSKGATVMTKDELIAAPPFPVTVKDTVGAGDSFDSGFITAILEGKNARQAAAFATVTAALTCTGTGPLEKMPRRAEVDSLLSDYRFS